MARKYPLELILRAHGPAELLDADETTIWVSDTDDGFKAEFRDEFMTEDDIEDILDYLADVRIITESEWNAFEAERFDVIVETLESSVAGGPGDDDDDEDEDEDDLTEYDDD